MNKIILIAAAFAFCAGAQAADPAAGKEKAKTCAACHGEGGVGKTEPGMQKFPKLAGQYNDYLVRALKDYQSGARKDTTMAGMVKDLKAADIADLAAYYSGQQALVGR